MPAWFARTRQWVQQGRLVVIGVAQEQHPNRCRLFAQWQQLTWPILYDPINVMQVRGVPIEVAIDEHGIVRILDPKQETLEKEFLAGTFSPEGTGTTELPAKATRPDVAALRQRAEVGGGAAAWRALGDARVLWEGPNHVDDAIAAYRQAIDADPNDGAAHFRLGVCYRLRYESPRGVSTDFQTAVDCWMKARTFDPNQYIWRRRIEQYGPRSTKPYPFYDWVERAARDIRARGDVPVPLRIEPTGSEIAAPDRTFETDGPDVAPPDPNGRITRDTQSRILTEVTVDR